MTEVNNKNCKLLLLTFEQINVSWKCTVVYRA